MSDKEYAKPQELSEDEVIPEINEEAQGDNEGRQAAQFAVDAMADKFASLQDSIERLEKIEPVPENIGKLKGGFLMAIRDISDGFAVSLEAMRKLESETVEAQAMVAQVYDMRMGQIEDEVSQSSFIVDRLNNVSRIRLNEQLQTEQLVQALYIVLCEQGILQVRDDDGNAIPIPEDMPEDPKERRRAMYKFVRKHMNEKVMPRIYEEVLGIRTTRGPQGATQLVGGVEIDLFGVEDTEE